MIQDQDASARLMPPATQAAAAVPAGRILSEIASSISTEDDLDALLRRFLVAIVGIAGASAGAARVLSDDGAHLNLVGAVGLPQDVFARELAIDHHCGACGQAAKFNTVQDIRDLQACARRTSPGYFGGECRRMLAVPLAHKGKVLGVYNLFLSAQQDIGVEVSALLQSIGELLGLALENGRLARENLRATVMHERQMMANEVHDSLAQTLSYMKMRMVLLEKAVVDHNEVRSLKYLGDVREALTSAYATLRELLTHFRRRMDPQGLLHALGETVATYYDKTGVLLHFDNEAAGLHLSMDQEMEVFHIVQEALANISRHSGAKHARLAIGRRDGQCEITIEDDGTGFAGVGRAETTSHFGMNIMRERAHHLGGEVAIESPPAGGTRVRLHFPVNIEPRAGA